MTDRRRLARAISLHLGSGTQGSRGVTIGAAAIVVDGVGRGQWSSHHVMTPSAR
jgi:hypothetical protein